MGTFGEETVYSSQIPDDIFGLKPKMKKECSDLMNEAILAIQRLEVLKEKRRFANFMGFDTRVAQTTLDQADRFITRVGTQKYLSQNNAHSLLEQIENKKKELPAIEYVNPEQMQEITLPIFTDLANMFAIDAITAVINCECKRKL